MLLLSQPRYETALWQRAVHVAINCQSV